MKKELSDKVEEDPYDLRSSDFIPVLGLFNYSERTNKFGDEYNFNRDVLDLGILIMYNIVTIGILAGAAYLITK